MLRRKPNKGSTLNKIYIYIFDTSDPNPMQEHIKHVNNNYRKAQQGPNYYPQASPRSPISNLDVFIITISIHSILILKYVKLPFVPSLIKYKNWLDL